MREPQTASRFEKVMTNPRRVLTVILFAGTLVNIPLIVLALSFTRSIQLPLPDWVEALVIFGLIVLICDFCPKVLALADPFAFSRAALNVLEVIIRIAGPFSDQLQRMADRVADLFAKEKSVPGDHLNDDELITLIELSAEQGQLRTDEREMIQEIIKLGDKTAGDCMTPRVDAFTIPDSLTNDEVIRLIRMERQLRVPVYGDSPDEILGFLDVKRFLLDHEDHYTEHLDSPSVVPETIKALDLLRAFLTHPQRIAIVVDEFGGTAGIITFTDIVEEMIGDAVPRGDEELYIESAGPGKWLVSGSARLDDLAEITDVQLAKEGVDTIGGLIFNQLGYVPKPGVMMELPPLRIEIRQSSRRRILELSIEKIESVQAEQ